MKNKIKIKVVGKNVNRFIIKLNKNKINIYQINKKNQDCYYLVIDYNAFNDVLKYKTIYDINIVDYLGPHKIKNKVAKNKFFILSIIVALILILILTRLTFRIKIVTNNQKLNKLIREELKKQGIYKYAFLKNYQEINNIKKILLNKYKDTFEWLEIERKGTGYIIRFEQRIENKIDTDNKIYDIVALKDSRILDLDIEAGQIMKNRGEYVKKGEVIVSSDITFNEEVKSQTSAKGKVYGEVWYKVSITIPNDYVAKKISDNSIKTYSLNFFSFKMLFNKSSFFDKIIISKPIIKNKLFKISFNEETIKEVVVKKYSNKEKEAQEIGLNEIENKLKEKEEIIDYIVLTKKQNKDNYLLEMFISVKENIGTYIAR